MRLKTTKYEILIAPDNEFILIVVQGQKSEEKMDDEPWFGCNFEYIILNMKMGLVYGK